MLDDYYIDSETCGFMGPMVLFQYAIGDGPVKLHDVWLRPGRETLDLIERVVNNNEIGFNLVFDHFKMQQIQNMLYCLTSRQLSAPPRIADMAAIERSAPLRGPCVKAAAPLDMYLHLLIGPFQSLMERKPIRIRKVPEMIAPAMVSELQQAFQFDWIYTKRKKEGPSWKVTPSKDAPGFVDISFSFGASRTLKSIHRYVFDSDPIEFPMPESLLDVVETPWSPYADNRPGSWPFRIQEHINYWRDNKRGRKYGAADVTMVRDLRREYGGTPGDVESTLACLIASVRYRGFPIDIDGVNKQFAASTLKSQAAGTLDWRPVLAKLHDLCQDPLEVSIITSTKDESLEALEKWVGEDGKPGGHPVAVYASQVRMARKHRFRAQWLGKLAEAGRFHPSLNPVGTLTRRASGSGGLNPQNIDTEPETRSLFLLADKPASLEQYIRWLRGKDPTFDTGLLPSPGRWRGVVGDFESFETVLAIAAWQDELLQEYVNQGIKPYHVFGSYLYRRVLGGPRGEPEVALENIRKKCAFGHGPKGGKPCECTKINYANRAKNCWYALIYGAQEFKISQTAGVPIEHVAEALKSMGERCVGMARGRQRVFDDLACIVQEDEGKPFFWNEPKSKIANLLGWERDFAFEIGIIKTMFEFQSKMPRDWREIEVKVIRRNREQTVYGAACSAVFGAAKQMEARMKRQAGNSIMQSSGAMYNKDLQTRQWHHAQPSGIHPWNIVLLNIHDELDGGLKDKVTVTDVTKKALREYAKRVPLVALEWQDPVNNWSEKH